MLYILRTKYFFILLCFIGLLFAQRIVKGITLLDELVNTLGAIYLRDETPEPLILRLASADRFRLEGEFIDQRCRNETAGHGCNRKDEEHYHSGEKTPSVNRNLIFFHCLIYFGLFCSSSRISLHSALSRSTSLTVKSNPSQSFLNSSYCSFVSEGMCLNISLATRNLYVLSILVTAKNYERKFKNDNK